MDENVWAYRPVAAYQSGMDLTGFKVEASDGSIGKVDKHSEDVGAAYIVVDTGTWIFGKEVLLPAGVVVRVDPKEKKIYVDRTKDQIKSAPEFDKEKHLGNPDYHQQVGTYYAHPRPRPMM
ncbi:PRC-barrel domain-containing protein [Streptomyces sp. WM6378]|uniref:PRC-barrel domain-containing protein n=1 Tax=Streptomyces sp. WM6378 TaxID=1415557 RepID=UPI0006AEE540|nr:PRC-barrel domain-containing protein [Streptomyces sp. WM6378]